MNVYKATNVTLLASGVVLVLAHQLQRRTHLLDVIVDVIDIESLDVEAMGLTNEDVEPMLEPFEADIDDLIACQINQPVQFKAGELFGYDGEVTKAMHAYMVPIGDQSMGDQSEDDTESVKPEDDDEISDDRLNQLVDAIGLLEQGNDDHWTKDGKPEVSALKELIEGKVSASERDAAWSAMNVTADNSNDSE